MRLRIGVKLAIGFLSIVLVMGAGGWWSYRSLGNLQSRYGQLLDKTYPAALAALNLNVEIQSQSQRIMQYAATRDSQAIDAIRKSRDRADGYMSALKEATAADQELATAYKAVDDQRARFYKMVNSLFVDGDGMKSDDLLLSAENARSVGEKMSSAVNALVTLQQNRVEAEHSAVSAMADSSIHVLQVVALVVLVLTLLIIFLGQLLIGRPVARIAAELKLIASGAGDLTKRIHIRTGDELESLADSFNQLQQSMQVMVKQIMQSSGTISERTRRVEQSTRSVVEASGQVSQAMGSVAAGADTQVQSVTIASSTMEELVGAISQIASGANMQAMQVQQTTATVNSMVNSMREVAGNANNLTGAAAAAADTAREGARIVDETVQGMLRIRERVLNSALRIQELDSHSRRINDIMVVITDIASQTNLLALNAAIEAARAGAQGRGFAVVAEEVRKLAERSGQSAKEIRTLIQNIQAGTAETVKAINEGARDAEAGADLAASAGEALKAILESVERTKEGSRSISVAANQVLKATQEVAGAVEEVAAVSEENSAATEEMAAGANQVSETIIQVRDVSLDNNTAVEQVASSLQEVNESMTSIAETTNDLIQVAEQLSRLMGQFKVE
ncbi:MAG TPA: HAMP domain-containing methyl-accepting chemotaxis protein [Symbiobacteriaceae bacterium]|jgi:methyl-accepting chemotaxis protein